MPHSLPTALLLPEEASRPEGSPHSLPPQTTAGASRRQLIVAEAPGAAPSAAAIVHGDDAAMAVTFANASGVAAAPHSGATIGSANASTSAVNGNGANLMSSGGAMNSALLFVKPHANTPPVRAFVRAALAKRGVRIVREGTLSGQSIRDRAIIDQHYAAIGKYAMTLPAKALLPHFSPEATEAFGKLFGLSPSEAIQKGILMNAAECMKQYAMAPMAVAEAFDRAKAAKAMLKIGPGCYAARLAAAIGGAANNNNRNGTNCSSSNSSNSSSGAAAISSNGPIVVNGFYLKMRAEYVADTASVTWFVVEWPAADLSWAAFRASVLGATDPSAAAPESIRRQLLLRGPLPLPLPSVPSSSAASSPSPPNSGFGLGFVPNMAANCVHGSAGPLEALNERLVWVGTDCVATDPYGRYLVEGRGLRREAVAAMLSNPTIASEGGRSLFDLVEGMDSTECANTLVKIASKL